MYKKLILDTNNIGKSAFFWNTLSGICNSFLAMIFMLVMTRLDRLDDASYISISFTIANLMMMVGKYGIRNYQATDIEEKYTYKDYIKARYVTTILMMGFSVVYIGFSFFYRGYSAKKTICVVLVCFLRVIDVIEDVLHGRLQQNGRLDVAAKILTLRYILLIMSFVVLYYYSHDLIISLLVAVAEMAIAMVLMNMVVPKDMIEDQKEGKLSYKSLLRECFPAAVGMLVIMYIGNAPKYIVDTIVTEEVQTHYSILFLTLYVVALLGNIVFVPVLNKLARLLNEKKIKNVQKIIAQQLILILGITLAAIVFCRIIGLSILGKIYKVNLSEYNNVLSILLVAGGLLAFINLANAVMIAFRKQVTLLVILAIAAIEILVSGQYVLIHYGLQALCILYMVVLIVNSIVLLVVIETNVKQFAKRKGE